MDFQRSFLLIFSIMSTNPRVVFTFTGYKTLRPSKNLSTTTEPVTTPVTFSLLQPTSSTVEVRKVSGPYFSQHKECLSRSPGASTLPNAGPEFQAELLGTHVNSNLSYRTAIFYDSINSRGVVAMDFKNQKEIILYDLKRGKACHVRDQTCSEEPLSLTSCNPLAYFVLRNDKSGALAKCKFETSKPQAFGFQPEKSLYKWSQCLRFRNQKENYVSLITYYFRLNVFSNNPVNKYLPTRIEVDQLAPSESSKGLTDPITQRVIFDFLSYRPRLRNRSIFQASNYNDCASWNNTVAEIPKERDIKKAIHRRARR